MRSVAFGQLEAFYRPGSKRGAGTWSNAGDDASPTLTGQSQALLNTVERGLQAAASEADILIEAESGTGKEVLARMIHHQSARRGRPFVAVNCSAVPEALLELSLIHI